MVKIYVKDVTKSYSDKNPGDPIYAGTTYYQNKKGKTVLIESWCSSSTGINPTNNIRYYIVPSNIKIKNLGKLNGTYVSNYVFNQDIYDYKKDLDVYYTGVTNNQRVKIIYREAWTKVSIKYA